MDTTLHVDRPPIELTTGVPGLVLRELDPSEAQAFGDLVARNRDHLMAGNGSVPPERVEEVVEMMCFRLDRSFGFGLWLEGTLIGHVSVGHLSLAVTPSFGGSGAGVLGHVHEPGVLVEEGELDEAGRAVPVLGDDHFGHAPLGRLDVVHLRAMQKHDDVRILFQ